MEDKMTQDELNRLIQNCLWLSHLEQLRLVVHNEKFVPALNCHNNEHNRLGRYLENVEHMRVFWVK